MYLMFLELQENEENNRDDIRNMDIEKGLEESQQILVINKMSTTLV